MMKNNEIYGGEFRKSDVEKGEFRCDLSMQIHEISTAETGKIDTIAIGHFDGVHLGHQKLFDELGKNGGIVVIVKDGEKLTPFRTREKFVKFPVFYYDLKEIKNLSGSEFLKILNIKFTNLKKIVVGYDFKFGKDRKCDTEFLKNNFNGITQVINEFCINKTGVHTTIIRVFLKNGNIDMANQFLGRKYEIEGAVISGQGLGKKDLVATLNLQIDRYFLPKNGVYATFTKVNERIYKSVSFIGSRISTDGKFSVETHIIDDFSDISCDLATIYFIDFLRENKKFNDLSELKKRILIDIKNAKSVLESEQI